MRVIYLKSYIGVFYFAILLFLFSSKSFGYANYRESRKAELYPNKLNSCIISKQYKNNYEPKVFNKSNNLLRYQGGVAKVNGQKIKIFGRVVDKYCNPIKYASVFIWQVGDDGKYPYEFLRDVANEKMQTNSNASEITSTFLGSGTAKTDNNGQFSFISIYSPSIANKEAPHVNLRIISIKEQIFQTKAYLGQTKVDRKRFEDSDLVYYEVGNKDNMFFPSKNEDTEYNTYYIQITTDYNDGI